MKKNILLSFIVLIISFQKTIACLNGESKILKNGTFLYEDTEGIVPYGHDYNFEDFPEGVKQLDSLYKVIKDLDYLSDKGLLIILLQLLFLCLLKRERNQINESLIHILILSAENPSVGDGAEVKSNGFTVRCIKDH